MKKLLLFFICLLPVYSVFSKTITVRNSADSGEETLRQAVGNADNGDIIDFDNNITTIQLADVIEINKNITISGKETNNISFYPNALNSSGFYFEISEGIEAIFNHLIFKDKNNSSNCTGGAIYSRGNLILNNCTFTNNRAYNSGGAITSLPSCILIVDNCIFSNNYAPQSGGAILNHGELYVSNSFFSENYGGNGGAIYNNSNAICNITNSIFKENTSSNGGAIRNYGTTTIGESTFEKNKASQEGGAISSNKQIDINNSTFYQNEAVKEGIFSNASVSGGNEAKATLVNCLFTNNSITGSGFRPSIVSNNNGTSQHIGLVTLINCTVADNTGVGITYLRTTVVLKNTILWNNTSIDDEQYDIYNDVVNGGEGVIDAYNSLIGTGNIDLNLIGENNLIGINNDPLFVNAENNDYTLHEDSPAIDAGNKNFYPYNDFPKDLFNKYRIDNDIIDMGAYEYQSGNPLVANVPPINNNEIKIYSQNRTIIVENTTEPVQVYNLLGKLVASGMGTGNYATPLAGVYIVKMGNVTSKKVIVR